MKYNKILIALLFIGLAACSGDDFLSLPSETDLVTETFFQSQGDFEKAVNGAYGPLLYLYRGNTDPADGATFWAMAEMHSDNSHYIHNPNYRATTDWEQISNFIYDPTSDIATQVYRTNYQIIARSNEILDKIDAVDFDADVKDNLKGQAHFLRAMAYFNLVQYYGEVPMHLEPVSSFEGVALPLSPVNDIYAQIVLDAVEAATLLPPKSEQEAGRATSGAAQTLLGNVYLVQEDFVAAETVLRNVVNSGEYQLMTNYADVFDPNNKNNIESVFEVQYKEGTEGYASNFTYTFVPQPITAAELTTLMEQYITAPTGITALTQEAYNVPTPDIIQAYEAGDLRLDATIGYGDAGGTTYPFVRKYLHEHSAAQLTNNSWPVYRYSEVLLLLAEALIEQGKESDALPFINEVRQRAGLADITATANLADALLQERRIELAFENKRWLDLVRLEKAVDVISDFGARVKANPQDYYYPAGIGPVPAAFTDIQLTFPLPAAEAQLSPYF
ncbi:RagB/SusD family nutrient uptake outer membrane protein [Roseivirga pacifica]|uniref:RagB/SusD family nutrient uptake outer membrane protein n=1 Tax=Roseivirga pacifica TaxID=1267423 RepID=UPI00227CE16F|nr:RagB/SusD family nutrient uptake outer membrane protein [Roseivirga pacifica]